MTKGLLLAASMMFAVAGTAQGVSVPPGAPPAPASVPAKPEKTVEGATPGRVAQVERCQGRKFESIVEIDPVKKRSTRIKLCANPGSSDADWVKTLEAAVAQIEQRDMPALAKDKLIGELESEISKYGQVSKPAIVAPGAPVYMTKEAGPASGLIAPTERFETSVLPPLPPPLPRKLASRGATATTEAPPRPVMNIRIKCLARGESGAGGTCDFFDRDTMLVVSAVQGLEKGGALRFLRRGEARDEVVLTPLAVGQSVRVRLPAALCRGIAYSKVEIELLGPKSTGAASARLGPYGLRC